MLPYMQHAARELHSQVDLTNIAITLRVTIVIYNLITAITERTKETNALAYRTEPKSPHTDHLLRQTAI